MSILIFIIILSMLIFVHELGHFLAAKKFGIRVDEFGIGYPPKARRLFSWRGTDFTLNWLPFGGFVKIYGENPDEEPSELSVTSSAGESFQNKNRGIQAIVLAAGVMFNVIFAWLLISLGFMSGLAAPVGTSLPVENAQTLVTTVIPGSPAAEAGLKSGDAIVGLSRGEQVSELDPARAAEFISSSFEPVTFELERARERREVTVQPESGIVADRPAVGISMDLVGTVELGFFEAFYEGAIITVELTWQTARALTAFIGDALTGSADLTQVAGPVGIVAMVGDAEELGFSFLLSFTALISINLALINLVPFPALDGGRLLFVGIEALRRKPVPPRVFNVVNTIGFALLIFLMVLITIRDVTQIL